jgi:hypothetical protein
VTTPLRGYEVVEKATAYRTYIVFARTAREAAEQVRRGENPPHAHNHHDDGHDPVIVAARRSPGYDQEAPS